MNRMIAASLMTALGMAIAGCATVKPQERQVVAKSLNDTTCHVVTLPQGSVGKDKVYCGTSDQWSEFERRGALVNVSMICREVAGLRTGKGLCMTADNWKAFQQRRAAMSPGPIFTEQQNDAALRVTPYQSPYAIFTPLPDIHAVRSGTGLLEPSGLSPGPHAIGGPAAGPIAAPGQYRPGGAGPVPVQRESSGSVQLAQCGIAGR